MKSKAVLVPLLVAAAVTSAAAADVKKPVARWTCEEFLALDDQYKPKLVYSAGLGGTGILKVGFVPASVASRSY